MSRQLRLEGIRKAQTWRGLQHYVVFQTLEDKQYLAVHASEADATDTYWASIRLDSPLTRFGLMQNLIRTLGGGLSQVWIAQEVSPAGVSILGKLFVVDRIACISEIYCSVFDAIILALANGLTIMLQDGIPTSPYKPEGWSGEFTPKGYARTLEPIDKGCPFIIPAP